MNTKTSKAVLGCIGLIIAVPLGIVVRGWVISVLWRWFVVPQFHVKMLGIWEAIGLVCVLAVLNPVPTPKENEYDKPRGIGETIGIMLFAPLGALAFGALYHWLAR